MTYTLEQQAENREKWVAALRSGEFKQARGYLSVDGVGMCCLGIACDLAIKDGVELDRQYDELDGEAIKSEYYDLDEPLTIERFGHDEGEVLPQSVRAWLGLTEMSGGWTATDGTLDGLALRNDRGATFEEIAALIESEPEGLFVS